MNKKDKNSAEIETIPMVRELKPGQSGPVTADVHPNEIDNWKHAGWRIEE